MGSRAAGIHIEVLLAGWVLERLPAERVPALAIAALEQGCDAPTVDRLAGLNRPTRADVEDSLPQLLDVLGRRRPSPDEALKVLVDLTAHDISGAAGSARGGIADLDALGEGDDRSPAWADFRPFLGLASECETPGAHVMECKAAIVQEATRLIERGGLRIPD